MCATPSRAFALALGVVLATALACQPAPPPGEGPPPAGTGGKPNGPSPTGGTTLSGTGGTGVSPPGTGGSVVAPGTGGTTGTGGAPAPDAGAPDIAPSEASPPPPTGEGITDGLKQLLVSRGIGLGYYHSCHLLASKDIKCFNSGDDARFHPPAVKSTQINCAHDGCCVLTGGDSTVPAPAAGTPDAPLPRMIQAKRLACWSHKTSFFPPATLDMDPIWFGIGYDHGCALNKDHSVTCWGNGDAKPQPPPEVNTKKVKSMAVASFFNCAVLMDDSVTCWGVNPPMPPAGLKAKLVAGIFHSNPKLPMAPGGTRHACAIQLDDTLVCWGDNVDGTTDVPADLGKVKDVALATYNSCALKLDGEPRCWGTRRYNMVAERWHPMPDPKTLKFKGIRAKLAAYCGLNFDDTLTCWGDESSTHLTIPAGTKILTSP